MAKAYTIAFIASIGIDIGIGFIPDSGSGVNIRSWLLIRERFESDVTDTHDCGFELLYGKVKGFGLGLKKEWGGLKVKLKLKLELGREGGS